MVSKTCFSCLLRLRGMIKTTMPVLAMLSSPSLPALADEQRVPLPGEIVPSAATANYCADAQQLIVATALDVVNQVHSSRDGFIKSKASMQPLTTHQMTTALPQVVNGQTRNFPTILSCKLKTADVLNEVYGEGSADEEAGHSCADLIRRDLVKVAANLTAELEFSVANIVIDEDDMTRMGPRWLEPWPYQTAYVDEAGRLHLRGKALVVPFSIFIPMPDRFKGNHYCHLPSVEYLAALLTGDIEPQALVEE